MATQLKEAAYPPIPSPASTWGRGIGNAPRPNIRVVFSAGAATLATRDKAASTPDATKTLEEIAIGDLTRGVIATAHQLLSPRMFTAFLRWGETASHLSTHFETDEEGNELSSCSAEAVRALAALPVITEHDLAIKQYLMLIEATDSSCFGPLRVEDDGETFNLNYLIRGLYTDLLPSSPLTQQLNQLARTAWEYSDVPLAWSLSIGGAVTSAFSEARGVDSVEREYGRQKPLDLSGYDTWMRAPLIAWNRQYDRYLDAAEQLASYDRDVHTPTFAVEGTPENGDAVQARYDELNDAMFRELDRLLGLPAPGAGELATKLKLWRQHDGYYQGNAGEVVDKLVIDARRFGRRGAHLMTDQPLLAAYASRRREFEANYGIDLTLEEGDAYLDRLDAYEAVLHSGRATTIEGVLAKLRVAFVHKVGEAWSDLAGMDPSLTKFRDGLDKGDLYDQLAWSAIEDLARIGGVQLAEQGR